MEHLSYKTRIADGADRDEAIESALSSLGQYTSSVRYQLHMIMVELINNGLEHGKNVHFSYGVSQEKGVPIFTCTVTDEGDGFDTSTIKHLDEAVANTQAVADGGGELEGGLGLAILEMMVDTMKFNDKGNAVTVTKSLVSEES